MSFIDEFESCEIDESDKSKKSDYFGKKLIESFKEKGLNYKILLISISVIAFALYFGNLLFGNKSLYTLLDLEYQNKILQKEVHKLEKDNFKKQKKYFELKELEDN